MNPVLHSNSKAPPYPGAQKDNILIVQSAIRPWQGYPQFLQGFCSLHFASSEKEAMDTLRNVADIRLVISDLNTLTADNYRLLKYLKLNGAFQGIPVINIAPVDENTERFTAFCFNISDFFLQELKEDQFSTFVKAILESEKPEQRDHEGVRTAYSSGKLLAPEEVRWMDDLQGLVSLHVSDPSYDTTKLAYDLHYSRSTLARKIQYLFGVNPGEYITQIRMKKAMHYLQNRQYVSIAQVASAVGFKHAGSFSRCFHNHFGVPPSDMLR